MSQSAASKLENDLNIDKIREYLNECDVCPLLGRNMLLRLGHSLLARLFRN